MWSTRTEKLADGRGLRVAVDRESSPVSFLEILRRWQNDATFRNLFIALLADAPFSAFRWETPPIAATSATRPFEFVLLDSPGLATRPDPEAFSGHFGAASAEQMVVSF